jgi:acyl dehydratase
MRDLARWEDLRPGSQHLVGPVTVSAPMLEEYLRLTGERHPIHYDVEFVQSLGRPERVVPGSMIHSLASGAMISGAGPMAVVGMRSMTWDFVRPVCVGTPWWCQTTVRTVTVIDDQTGLVELGRKVIDDRDHSYALGRVSLVVLRRDAP